MTIADSSSATERDKLIEELHEAVRARDDFVAIAAHELRNPMTPILMQVDSLLAAAKAGRCRPELIVPRLELLSTAVREFVRRSTMLLDISRIATGNVRIEPADTDLSELTQHVIDRLKVSARLARCSLHAELQPDIRDTWDPLALEQVIENLLSNAIKFGAGKPIAVRLRSDGKTARLSVQDQGIGISQQDCQRIFARFERAVTQREHGGFGLGLWLSHKLIVAMQGTLEIESVPGRGTTFTITLPQGGTERQEISRA